MGRASRGKAQARTLRLVDRQRRQAQEEAVARAAALFATSADVPLTLIVDTPLGVMTRRVAAALPRPEGVEQGIGAEEATHAAAAMWGWPDFVFRAPVRKVASGVRELGDRVVIVGRRAAVVQVKSREGTLRDSAGEQSWVRKQAVKAAKQAKGTVRQLCMEPARFVNGRGREIEVDGNGFEWIAVVVIDHDQLPEGTVADLAVAGLQGVVLLRRDWDFLFSQLRSTHAVIDYLFRIAHHPPRPLGEEPVRYYGLAADDLAAVPDPADPHWLGSGFEGRSTPQLPQAPVGSDRQSAHALLRVVVEEIATSPLPDNASEAARLQALADLDSLPVGFRSELGDKLWAMLEGVAAPTEGLQWHFRRVLDGGAVQLAFGVCSEEYSERVAALAQSYVELRHHQFEQAHGLRDERVTLLVLLTPRHDGERPFDTTMFRLSGRSGLSPQHLAAREDLWDRAPATRGLL